jgi:hypothetical protein
MDVGSLQDDYVQLLETANLWKFRAKAAAELAVYLSSLYVPGSAFMDEEDIRKEIEFQAGRLMERHKDGITCEREAVSSNTQS